jgi:SsrA-binding protein
MAKPKKPTIKSLSKNKKAFHDYEILEKFEAGIALNGDEVKSIRNGQANLKGSYIDVLGSEAFLNEAHISRYKLSSRKDYDPTRKRKLLLHKKQILKIEQAAKEKGKTVVPLELYLKGGLIKVEVGICRGKKLHDKREVLKKRAQDLEIKRQLKKYQ